jgi:hypothetical protein
MNARGAFTLTLTADQVEQILAAEDDEENDAFGLLRVEEPSELVESPLLDDPKLSKSLLFGLVVLISFPADGSTRGNKEVAEELGVAASTCHRYVNTLVAAGLLEQDPVTRQYRRHPPAGAEPGRRRKG